MSHPTTQGSAHPTRPSPGDPCAYRHEEWFRILQEAVRDDPRGVTGVAERMVAGGERKVSRTQLSLVLRGLYPADTRHLAQKIHALLSRRACPYSGLLVTAEHCREVNGLPAPTWNPSAMDNRRVCDNCQHKPKGATT